MEFKHIPIMLNEVLEGLNIKPDGIYVDGTLGGAGHSSEIIKRLSDKGRLIGIDQDMDAIKASSERLQSYENAIIIHSNYVNMRNVLLE
ncbi:MAG: 16S rRNA (cytosine(1402)-N(4))-methyltransferase, partial [Eubacterium sp.]|nr:16S rRNA (cytosine(1402)-N(4))-methyltransferase [Eubacterium sp.]